MSNELARAILAMKADGASIVYGEATAVNTVALEGAATPVELPALSPVAAGQYVAVLQQGADRLILGPVATPWTAVTFQNSWANPAFGYQPAQYRKVGDMTQLRGTIAGGTLNTSAILLPIGFRPTITTPIGIGGFGGGATIPALIQPRADGTCFVFASSNNEINITCQFSTAP